MAIIQRDIQIADKPTLDEVLHLTEDIQARLKIIDAYVKNTDVSFSSCSDATLNELVQLSLDGVIDLYKDCGWRVGDTRTIHLKVLPFSTDGITDDEIDSISNSYSLTVVLSHHGQRNGVSYQSPAKTTSGTDRLYPAFEWDMVELYGVQGKMFNSNPTNEQTVWWPDTMMHQYFSNRFYKIFPEYLRKRYINVIYSTSTEILTDTVYVSLRALKEMVDTAGITTSIAIEHSALEKVDFYKASANRIKKPTSSSGAACYYLRSADKNGHGYYGINESGNSTYLGGTKLYHISPFGCIG